MAWDIFANDAARKTLASLQRHGWDEDSDAAITSPEMWREVSEIAAQAVTNCEGSFLIFGETERGRDYVASMRELAGMHTRMIDPSATASDGKRFTELVAVALRGWTESYLVDEPPPSERVN